MEQLNSIANSDPQQFRNVNKSESFFINNYKIIKIVVAVVMIITGVIYTITTVKNISMVFEVLANTWFYSFLIGLQFVLVFIYNLIAAIGFIGGGVILLIDKKLDLFKIAGIIIAVSYILSAVTNLLSFINFRYDYSSTSLIPTFIYLVCAALWIIGIMPLINRDVKINFVVPVAITFVLMVIRIIIAIINYYYLILYLNIIFETAALILCCISVNYFSHDKMKGVSTMTNTQQNINQPIVNEPEGYIKVWLLIVLSIVTLGIYTYYWIYKTTGTLNEKLPNSEPMNQVPQLLLCMFVPFYIIYWVYKTCKRIEEYSLKVNTGNNDLSLIGLLLTIFGFGIVAYALMQDQINKNVMVEAGLMKTAQPRTNDFVPQQIEQTPVAQPTPQAAPVQPIPQEAPVAPTPAPAPQAAPVEPEKKKIKVTKEQYESLLMIKELLDQDIITKEEFIQKKNEILG